jgi:hypothetical protein
MKVDAFGRAPAVAVGVAAPAMTVPVERILWGS